MSNNNQISIDGDNNIVLQDINGSHIYINSDDGVRKLIREQEGKIQEILQILQAQNTPQLQPFIQKISQISNILDLIDSDMESAFDELDRMDWGNRKGTYYDLKSEWIDPPMGFSKSSFRSRLKVLVKSYLNTSSSFPVVYPIIVPPPSQQNLKAIQKEAKEKIIKGTDVAIKFLEEKLKEGNAKNSLSLLKAEWQEYRKEEMLGLMDFSQKQLRGNGLRYKVMTLIDDLTEEDLN